MLISYGSRQQRSVQLAAFARLLSGESDDLDDFDLQVILRGDKSLANVRPRVSAK